MTEFGKGLIILGLVIAAVGLFMVIAPKIPHVGRLPGDIYIKKKNFVFYFPITTCIIISIIISLILILIRR